MPINTAASGDTAVEVTSVCVVLLVGGTWSLVPLGFTAKTNAPSVGAPSSAEQLFQSTR
jgi:hypothetical protein